MIDMLFGQSYYLRFDKKLFKAMQPYPPLGTLYAVSHMREQGYDVRLFDAMLAESTHEWTDYLNYYEPRYAIIYEDNFNYLSKMSLLRMRDAAFEMIASAKAKGCTVIVSGADMTDHPEKYLQTGADYVIIGEGEETLTELISHLEGNDRKMRNEIQGIAFLDNTELVKTMPRPVMRDIDALTFPAWELIDHEKYRKVWQSKHGYYSVNMVTTRGCPFHCNWCAKPIWGQRYAVRSASNVVDEMQWLHENFQPDHIWFMDDIMGIQDRWIEDFANILDNRKFHIPFKSLNRVDLLLRGSTIPALARAGAKIVWVGAESGSQKILDAMDKGTKVDEIYRATNLLHSYGVKVAFFLQFGYPGETREDIELTLKMVRDLMPDDIGISVSYPLPGTPFYESVRSELGNKSNWVDSQDMAMLYQGPYATKFYRQLHRVVHKDYRSRKTWLELQNLVKEPTNLRPAQIRRTAAMIYHRLTLPLAEMRLNQLANIPHEPSKIERTPNVTLR